MTKQHRQKIDKHKIQREITANDKEITALLLTHTAVDMAKVKLLFEKNQQLLAVLRPPAEPAKRETLSPMDECERKNRVLNNTPDGYCENCGAPNQHCAVNGKPYCGICHRVFVRSDTQKPKKPKIQDYVTFKPIL